MPSLVRPDLIRHWRRVLRRGGARPLASTGQRIVILSTLGRKLQWPARAAVYAHALRLRGAEPTLLACDVWLEACEEGSAMTFTAQQYVAVGSRPVCDACFGAVDPLYQATGLEYRRLSEFEPDGARARVSEALRAIPAADLFELRYRGIDLGPAIETSVLRFYLRSTPPDLGDVIVEQLVRRYALAAMLLVEATELMIERLKPDVLVVHYGAYLSRGVPPLVAAQQGVRIMTLTPGMQMRTWIAGRGGPYLRELAGMATGPWTTLELTPRRWNRLDNWLRARETGTAPYVPAHMEADERRVRDELGIDTRRPLLTFFAPLGWDTRQMYQLGGYHVEDVILDLVRLAQRDPSLQLVLRMHPAELLQPGSESFADVVARAHPTLPENVRIVPATSRISSYALGRLSTVVCVYGSTLGLEMACRGKTVICVGGAPYRGKGFTHDVTSRQEIEAAIASLMTSKGRPDCAGKAMSFAYYYWFMREFDFPFWHRIEEQAPGVRGWWRRFRSLADLAPGSDAGLDIVCDAILTEREPYLETA